VQEFLNQLEALCKARGIEKFSPTEMVELLEDGEEVEWILGQVGEEGSGALGQLLQQIAAEIAPAGSEEDGTEDGGEVSSAAEIEEASGDKAEEEDFDPANLDMSELQGMLPPGVDMSQVQQMLSSPRGALLADFGTFCEERGVEMEMEQGEMSEALQELHEEWLQMPREALEGKKPAEVLDGGRLFPSKVETFRREAPKVGRNDPCSCGSGKKYKKCCGKAA
jgi:hypothetical protein